ncbi:MAG: PaaI family thioesterase [Pseudomonadota bacterium]
MPSQFRDLTADHLNQMGTSFLPGLVGVNILNVGDGFLEAEMPVRQALMAPNGFLHAGAVVTLADTACGYACTRALPEGAAGFTTIELKSNFLGTAREGVLVCRADAQHLGRTTQIWDAVVKSKGEDKTLALFRCTQMVLWPKK